MSPEDPVSVPPWRRNWLGLIVVLYCAPVVGALRPVADPDIWWHLRTGQWIVEHRTVPWRDPFSTYPGDRVWIAYSWLAEILLYGLHHVFGLVGLVAYATVLAVALTAVLHVIMLRSVASVARATALAALLVGGMVTGFAPRTYLLSMLLLALEVAILLDVRQRDRTWPLLFLPPLFVVWANVHVQFVYGLLVLALAVTESVIARHHVSDHIDTSQAIRLRPLVLAGVACCLATLLNPYHVHLYSALLDIVRQQGVWSLVTDLKAMEFRQPADWLVLGWALSAAFILGRGRRLPLFPALFLIVAAFISFRARRDAWLVVLAGAVTVAVGAGRALPSCRWWRWPRGAAIVAAVLALTIVLGSARGITPRGLARHVGTSFPAQAAAVVEARGDGPRVYNPYDWGGYLMWRLPTRRVSIDPRSNVHGDARIARSVRTWLGDAGWASDPELLDADVVIGPGDIGLTSLLRLDPRFALVYEDDVAAVFVPRAARTSAR